MPHIRGLSGKCRSMCNKAGIKVHLKGHNTRRTLLMAPKDKDNMCQKSGIIYHYKCANTDCPEQYKGESGRTFHDRFREHLRAPSPIHPHSWTTGHQVALEYFTIIDREAQGATRTIKEAIYI